MFCFVSAVVGRVVLGGRHGRIAQQQGHQQRQAGNQRVVTHVERGPAPEDYLNESAYESTRVAQVAEFWAVDAQDELNQFDALPSRHETEWETQDQDELDAIPEGLKLVTWDEVHDDVEKDWMMCRNRDMLSGRPFPTPPPSRDEPRTYDQEPVIPAWEELVPVTWKDMEETDERRRLLRFVNDLHDVETLDPVTSFNSQYPDAVDPELLDHWKQQAELRGGNAASGESDLLSPRKRASSPKSRPDRRAIPPQWGTLNRVHGGSASGRLWRGWEWTLGYGVSNVTTVVSTGVDELRLTRRRDAVGGDGGGSIEVLGKELGGGEDRQVFDDGSYATGTRTGARMCLVDGDMRAFVEVRFCSVGGGGGRMEPVVEMFGVEQLGEEDGKEVVGCGGVCFGGDVRGGRLSVGDMEGEWHGSGRGMLTDAYAWHYYVLWCEQSLVREAVCLESVTWQDEGLWGRETDPRVTKKGSGKRKSRKVRAARERDAVRFERCELVERTSWWHGTSDGDGDGDGDGGGRGVSVEGLSATTYFGAEATADGRCLQFPALDGRAPMRRVEILSEACGVACSYPEFVSGRNAFTLELLWFLPADVAAAAAAADGSRERRRRRMVRHYGVDGEPQGSVCMSERHPELNGASGI